MEMLIKFEDIDTAYCFTSGCASYGHQVSLNKETGEFHYHSEFGDSCEELPEDLDDPKYVSIPNQHDLDLGKRLIFQFCEKFIPDLIEEVSNCFTRKGAYQRYKSILEREDQIENWYLFEAESIKVALLEWCEQEGIETEETVYCTDSKKR